MVQDPLKVKFFEKAQIVSEKLNKLVKENGDLKVDEINLGQLVGGMRSVKSMLWETSELDPELGIKFRGYDIFQLRELLPKVPNGTEPLPEALFWLMLVDEIPTQEEAQWLTDQWMRRSVIPDHVFKVLDSLPKNTHPMSQFSIAITAMQNQSIFARRHGEGMNKNEYWNATYEDTMNLLARLPRIAAYIYRRTFHNDNHINPDITLDWAGNFAHMLGVPDPDFKRLMRLYLTIHADHEGGNGSAHATHLVGSTLSDAYLSLSSGMNALAGPLHGLANQEVITWIIKMVDILGTETPSDEQVEEYIKATLASGRVVPGYGHAVLRKPDPRFLVQKQFAEEYGIKSNLINIVWQLFRIAPPMLESTGKVKNPWPNVDAHSGAILVHYGLTEHNFYTVLFGVSRSLGVLASLCWSRALGLGLERPKSVSTNWLHAFAEKQLATKSKAN
ncbi:MAG: citrate (Si)-synthase [Saprospiraceae bacterium]|nr:citrate (Si)-synthase [Saprospiraceae bacterium]